MLRGKRDPEGCCRIPNRWVLTAGRLVAAIVIACAVGVQTANAQPANDDCSTPTPLVTGVATVGSSLNATGTDITQFCFNLPDTNDVWFSWVADCTADVTVSACGSAFNTTLSVFDPPCGEFMLDFACNDDSCGLQSEVVFSATSGNTYLIRLAGINGATGNYTITVTCPPIGGCCLGAGFCQADTTEFDCSQFFGVFLGDGSDCSGSECDTGACCTSSGCTDGIDDFACSNLAGTFQGFGSTCATAICPEYGACCGFADGMCTDLTEVDCAGLGGNYLGDATTCAIDGAACATGACCSTSTGCSQTDFNGCSIAGGTFFGGGTSCVGRVCNEDCDTAVVVDAVPYVNQIDNAPAANGAAGEFGSCDGAVGQVGHDVWYKWTPSADCEATVSWTPLVGQDNVLIVWQGDDFDCASGNFNNANVATYEVDCQECDGTIETCPDDDAPEVSTFFAAAGTTYWFQCGQEGAFPDAGGLSEFAITCSTTTGGCCVGGVCTEQFPTQCAANGGLYAGDGTDCTGGCPGGACCETAGTCDTYATQTACETAGGVWQGDGVDCLDVNCGGACCLPGSCIDAGSESLCLGMSGTYLGNGTTCATSVCNDDCANAISVESGVTYNGTNVGATGADESSCAGTADINDVWHTWVAECTDTVTVSLCGSSFDTSLAVFDGCGGTEIACNDDTPACGANNSQLDFSAVSGTTYWIRVAGWNGASGTYALVVDCPPFGACCVTGSCSDLSLNDCNTAGGTFLGDGTDCATNSATCTAGACCLLNGTCSDGVMEADCLSMSGQYLGGATECSTSTCSSVGACCTSGVCEVIFSNDCIAGGGDFLGEGTICEAGTCMGACCFENACTIEDQANCEGAGQIFWGPGSLCEDIICPGPGFVQLNNNWNGIAHPSEQGDPDRLPGYRTIGDRGLMLDTATSVGGGTYSVISGNLQYSFETRPDVLDMVMVGRRSVIAVWDDINNTLGDNIGVAPSWDPTGGTGTVVSNTTTLTPVVVVDDNFELGVLSHGTEGGGRFNMTLTFTDMTTVTVQVHAPDWFANGNATPDAPAGGLAAQALLTPAPLSGGDGFDAVAAHDRAETGAPLNLTQSTVTRASILGAFGIDVSGKSLQSITFDAWAGGTFSAGGIYGVAMAVPGACCLPDGNCSEGVRTACINAGGIYQGDGTECAVVGASCAIGACCFTNGTCADNYQASTCFSEGGFYLGSGTMCATSSCPPTGACCNPTTFECTIDFGAACTNAGNFYSGDGSDCTFGCDCNNNSTLDLFELLPSTDCNSNGILDECETPNPSTVGACCIDEVCSLETDGDCATAGGVFFGYCTDCSLIVCPGEGYVDLDFNWNGVVHPGESNMADAPDGYRSISDRGLLFGNANSVGGASGILTLGNLTYYMRQLAAPSLDIIHIGGRGNAWDLTSDGDNVGIQPNWDPSTGTGQSVPMSVSTFAPTPVLNNSFELGVLYHAGNGGGNFRMTLGFTDTSSVSVTLNAPDWFANNNGSPTAPQTGVATQAKLAGPLSSGDGFAATSDNDNGNPDQPLNCIQAVVTATSLQTGLGFDVAGRQLNSITFDNWGGSANGGNAIFAASYYNPTTGACTCPGDANLDNQLDGSDVQSFVDCLLGGMGDCSCADVDGMNGTDMGDIAGFVSNLLAGPTCPAP